MPKSPRTTSQKTSRVLPQERMPRPTARGAESGVRATSTPTPAPSLKVNAPFPVLCHPDMPGISGDCPQGCPARIGDTQGSLHLHPGTTVSSRVSSWTSVHSVLAFLELLLFYDHPQKDCDLIQRDLNLHFSWSWQYRWKVAATVLRESGG